MMRTPPTQASLGLLVGLVVGTAIGFGVGNWRSALHSPEDPPPPPATVPPEPHQGEVPSGDRGKLSLFILAGQSNMSGRGKMPPSGTPTHPRIFLFGNDYRWHLASEPTDDATNQVDLVSEDKAAGFSPGMAFARGLLERGFEPPIGLIPCAKAGTAIAEWQRSMSDRTLYGSCLKRVRAASTMGKIAGLLFFQGEADGTDPQADSQVERSPYTWDKKFTAFITDFRNDLSLPDLPVVFAEIAPHPSGEPNPFRQMVKAQQRGLELPNGGMITTDGLEQKPDDHFTTESYRIIGDRFAEAFWTLQQPGKTNPEK